MRPARELWITLGLVEADGRQGRHPVSLQLFRRHQAGRAARHPAAPGEPDNGQCDSTACGAVQTRFKPFRGLNDVILRAAKTSVQLLSTENIAR